MPLSSRLVPRFGALLTLVVAFAVAMLAGSQHATASRASSPSPSAQYSAAMAKVRSMISRSVVRSLQRDRRRPAPKKPAPGTNPAPSPVQPPAPAPQPSPVPPGAAAGRVGVNGPLVWYSTAEQLAYLRRAKANGLTWARQEFFWGVFEQQPGVWNFEVGDRLMRNASIAGVDILAGITYSAQWASSGPTIYYPPRDFAAYANFCRVVVQRYGPGGTFWAQNPNLAPRPVTAVEIWNEPWTHHFWKPNPDPAAYVRLLRASAEAVRAANPEVKILASGDVFQMRADTNASLDWIEPLLQLDPALFRGLVDAYSVHLYTQHRAPFDMGPVQRWRFDRALITRKAAQAVGADHPLWVTEFGWSTFNGHPDSVTETQQAAYVRQALDKTLGDWSSFVERSFMYTYGKAASDYDGGYGPLRPDGSEKPLWGALNALLRP